MEAAAALGAALPLCRQLQSALRRAEGVRYRRMWADYTMRVACDAAEGAVRSLLRDHPRSVVAELAYAHGYIERGPSSPALREVAVALDGIVNLLGANTFLKQQGSHGLSLDAVTTSVDRVTRLAEDEPGQPEP